MFTLFFRRFLLICILAASCLRSSGQPYFNQTSRFLKANGVWAFGDSTGLNFNAGGPVPFKTSMRTDESAASIADPETGQLLFYTDAMSCWDANHQLMPNGNDLMGGVSNNFTTHQGACIVPVIGTTNRYYIFSLNFIGFMPSLFYSVVDMSLNGGLGDVIAGQKAILLNGNSLSEGMIAIPGDNCDIWLLLHRFPEAEFIAYHITSAGIDPTPVVSATGLDAQRQSMIAVSSDRRLVAMANTRIAVLPNPGVQLGQFDPGTGIVSNAFRIDSNYTYGICFSPDNSKLYTSYRIRDLTVSYISYYPIRQYDISSFNAATIAGTAIDIDTPSVGNPPDLKLYHDTIYLGMSFSSSLARINKPNLSGTACDYQEEAVSLMSDSHDGMVIYGLNNAVVFPMPPDTSRLLSLDTMICTHNRTPFSLTLESPPGYSGYVWDDNSIGATRTISMPGAYWVLGKDSCHARMDSFIVRQKDLSFSLGNDTVLCDEAIALALHVDLPGAAYLWQNGSKGDTYTAEGAGTYWVRVSDSGCIASDTIHIEVQPFEQNLGPDMLLCREEPVQVTLEANAPAGSTITWNTGSHDPRIVARDTGLYWVQVNGQYCSAGDTVHIATEICDCIFRMPNAFTPNGDGLNDELKPGLAAGCAASGFAFSVYNRYGQRVFFSANSDKGWDGTFNGVPEDAGTYFFELRFTGGKRQLPYYQKGDVALIR